MKLALLTVALLACAAATGQNRPQLTWSGYVTGSALVYIQADRVDVQGRDTGSVDRVKFRLNDPLPAARRNVTLDVIKGEGRIRIAEQPTAGNEFSAVIRLESSSAAEPEFFQFDAFWEAAVREQVK